MTCINKRVDKSKRFDFEIFHRVLNITDCENFYLNQNIQFDCVVLKSLFNSGVETTTDLLNTGFNVSITVVRGNLVVGFLSHKDKIKRRKSRSVYSEKGLFNCGSV